VSAGRALLRTRSGKYLGSSTPWPRRVRWRARCCWLGVFAGSITGWRPVFPCGDGNRDHVRAVLRAFWARQVQKGDTVVAGQVLARSTDELALELSAAQADETRFEREVQQRGPTQAGGMQVAEARAAQAKAKLEILELQPGAKRSGGALRWRGRRGRTCANASDAPQTRRCALPGRALDKMYAEVLVREDDVRAVVSGAPGEIAFASKPAAVSPCAWSASSRWRCRDRREMCSSCVARCRKKTRRGGVPA